MITSKEKTMKPTIFTFWADKDKMPEYIKMCIESWKKHLPDYEIVILDYSNLDKYIGKDFYDKILFEKFTIFQQTCAFRAAVLEKHGGIWLDASTIVTNPHIENLFDDRAELNIFEYRIACIKAKQHAKILKKWIRGIRFNLFKYKHLFDFYFKYFPYQTRNMLDWDYLSNRILRKLLKTKNKKLLNNANIADSKTHPDILWDRQCNRRKFEKYPSEGFNHFYIKNDFSDYAKANNNGLIILNHSWMPRKYATFTRDEILRQNNTLSKLLSENI